MTRAVFLDRDDTLIACRDVTPDGDLGDPEKVRLLSGALDACQRLKNASFLLLVVSNQGGVARGRFDEDAVEMVNGRINSLLEGLIDRFYFCPYHPQGAIDKWRREHPWRKPSPGMLLTAGADLHIDLKGSWMIGDSPRDAQAGKAAGCRTILLADDESARIDEADFLARDLASAADIVLIDQASEQIRSRL